MAPIKVNKRSISFPSRSHPTINKVVEELARLKTWEASSTSTSGSIHFGLLGLEELYASLESVLGMGSIQELLSRNLESRFMDELLDGSMKLIDISDLTRDLLSRFKENIQALESALRRRKGNFTVVSDINDYTSFRKKMNKEVKKLMAARVNLVESKHAPSVSIEEDESFAMIAQILREVDSICFCAFKSLLAFLSISRSKSRQSKWFMVSKLVKTEITANEEKRGRANEVQRVDSVLMQETLQYEEMNNGLKALEMSIENLEITLGSVSRRLIRLRASILNILSQ